MKLESHNITSINIIQSVAREGYLGGFNASLVCVHVRVQALEGD